MWKLLRFLKPYRKESICAPLFKLLEVVFELLVPLVVAHMIDSGIGGADKGIIVRSVLLMITLGAVGLASATTAQYFAGESFCWLRGKYSLCHDAAYSKAVVCRTRPDGDKHHDYPYYQ